MTREHKNSTASLRDLFREEIEASGGNPSAAFIAVLDELDRRAVEGTNQNRKNAELVSQLIDWFREVDSSLEELPSTVTGRVSLDLRRLMPELTREMEEKATLGHERGQQPLRRSYRASEQPWRVQGAKKRKLAKVTSLGFPMAVFSAILFGMLFGSLIIPVLPNTWQWPCKLIGADYRTSTDPQRQTTFCVIQRD